MIFHLIHVKGLSIFQQLLLEEQLLREDSRNFCVINEGSSPAIVMGISGKSEELIHTEKALEYQYPVIKRFSGGGTVVVDENTLFVSFICNKQEFDFPAYPEKILKWSENFYCQAFKIPSFHLKENDFAIGNKKCGGNAQYIKRDRWVLHTSFLWDFSIENMKCLLHPRKTPDYREGRSHGDFLCTLKDYFEKKEFLVSNVKNALSENYEVISTTLPDFEGQGSDARRSTSLVEI